MRHGFLLIDKPTGPTSHGAVAMVRKQLAERDIGHLGTLDPAASGLLVLAVGSKALKVIELFSNLSKEYDAAVTFGAVSTTYDSEGVIEEVQRKPGWDIASDEQIRRLIIDKYTGKVSQVPPAFSAIHVNGKRAHELARSGQDVEMPTREVQIEKCTITRYAYPELDLHVRCGSGTYIRSLAHDLGQDLRCGAYLSGLRRTTVGEWSVEDSVAPDVASWTDVMPLKDVLAGYPKLELSDAEWEDIKHGRTIARTIEDQTFAWHNDLPVALLIPANNGCRPRKVL
jgi:tRNA pseudouridine55 synthase